MVDQGFCNHQWVLAINKQVVSLYKVVQEVGTFLGPKMWLHFSYDKKNTGMFLDSGLKTRKEEMKEGVRSLLLNLKVENQKRR